MSQDQRPSWDEYFMAVAEQVATRSTCLRRQIGAVIVKDKRILATGYNGAPSGLRHCVEVGCLRQQLNIPSGTKHELCRAIHAEQNAAVQAARYGIPIDGATIYTTDQPCVLCAKILLNAGIKEIVYRGTYPDGLAADLLEESGIIVRRMLDDGTTELADLSADARQARAADDAARNASTQNPSSEV